MNSLAIALRDAKPGQSINEIIDFSIYGKYLRKVSDLGGGHRLSGKVGKAQIDIYSGNNIIYNRKKFYAEGGKNLSQNIFNFTLENLKQENFPLVNIFKKEVQYPYAIRLMGYFDERSNSVIGTIYFNDWHAFYNFSTTILGN